VRKKVSEMKKIAERSRSHVGIVDRSIANLYHVHSDLFRSNATLKDRAEFNLKIWEGKNIFGA
jgi:hypothetical protein